jgi:hypothetical protein
MLMNEDGPKRNLPAGIERYVAENDLQHAADSMEYAWMLLERDPAAPGRDTVREWCYEFAAAGVPYWDWPDLALARQRDGKGGGALLQARRDALAQALVDYGENDSVRRGQGMDSQWT